MAKRCKFGPLKNPSGRRRCKKQGAARGRGTRCVNGKLKHPIGQRVCRKPTMYQRALRRIRKAQGVSRQEAKMWATHSPRVAGYRRRRSR